MSNTDCATDCPDCKANIARKEANNTAFMAALLELLAEKRAAA